MKTRIAMLSLLNGGFMLLDGIYVMINGKYIGPEKPGPWAFLFEYLGIDVFGLGPLFIAFGLAWLAFLYGFWTGKSWSYPLGLAISVLTLWYLPAGTVFSLIILIMLVANKNKLTAKGDKSGV